MNAKMASLMAKAVMGSETKADGEAQPFALSLLERFGLSPEKIKAELTQITDAIGARLQGIDDKLARIEAKLDAIEVVAEAERVKNDTAGVPVLTEMLSCTCNGSVDQTCAIHRATA